MFRYRLLPSPAQEAVLRDHCGHARYVWNLAVEQHSHWHSGRRSAPGYLEQCRQLTQARPEHPWLTAGSQLVQQQALQDFAQAMATFFDPRNPAERPVPAPGNGQAVGIDRGVAVPVALSTGEMLRVVGLTGRERKRLRRLEQKLARARRGSERRKRVKLAIAQLKARETDRCKDWAEKASTDIARRFDLIGVEDLPIRNMTRSARATAQNPGRNVRAKAGLNREILRSGWGLLARRLEDKAPDRVEKIKPHYTSQRCSACGQVDGTSRESQAVFRCTACGYASSADVNAARNIAAGHPTHLPFPLHARGGCRDAGPVNREPQLLASLTGREWLESLAFSGGGCQGV